MTTRIILASASPFRKAMLEQAGVAVEANASQVDERAVEAAIGDSPVTARELATILAEAKAVDVSERYPDALVIGSDQTLSLEGDILHKVDGMEGARRRLLLMSGKTHQLNSAVVLARGGEAIWRHADTADMTMRRLEPAFIGRYLAAAGDQVLRSVGVYQIEALGIQLFDRVEGDHFTIVGLPLLPLLAALRNEGAIDG